MLTISPQECDRNFTRSDALTKHMRSVHETDTLRLSDSKPNASTLTSVAGTPASKLQRIRLKLSHPAKEPGAEPEPLTESVLSAAGPADSTDIDDTTMPEYGPELGVDEHELAMHPRDLYRLLRRQIAWAEKETVQLRAEWDELRPKRERAWLEKEAIFDDVIDGELRLFSAIVGDIGGPAAQPANLSSSLERLQHQQQQFKNQQEQLQAKAEETAEVDAAA